MGLKKCSETLSKLVTSAKLVFKWSESCTCKNNVIKTKDLRCDIHRDISRPGWAIAKIQVNQYAKDPGARAFLRKGNKGNGHKTTHRILAEIPFSQIDFDETGFRNKVASAWRVGDTDGDIVAEGSGPVTGSSTSSEWVWWDDEGIWYRQMNGVDEWFAPESDTDSGWIYSTRKRNYLIKYANGTVVWRYSEKD